LTTLVDTSILLRLSDTEDMRHAVTQRAVTRLNLEGESLVTTPQNLIEFRGVATRPVNVNGQGMTAAEVEAAIDLIESVFPLLPDRTGVYRHWRRLCRAAGVSGKQVHDTRLVAVCVTHKVSSILTWNPRDFVRFIPFVAGLQVRTPDDVLAR